ncbi:MAG TPA: flippase [Terriglobales bacterium]|nr:flippase [Terriglobales bacterium]
MSTHSVAEGVSVAPASAAASSATATRRALGNSVFLAAYYIGDAAMLFGINVLLARHLGVIEYGRVALALSYGLLISALDPGFGFAVTKFVARDPRGENPWVRQSISLRLTLTAGLLLLGLVPLPFSAYLRQNAFFIMIVGGSEVLRSITTACCAVFRGFQSMGWEALVVATERTTLLGGAAWLLHTGHGTRAIGFMFLAARLVSLLLALAIVGWKSGSSIRFEPWPPLAGTLLWEAYPLSLMSLSARINLYLPPFLLGLLSGEAAAGTFQAAGKIIMLPYLICDVIGGGMFPAMSAAYRDSAQIRKLYRYGVRLLWHCLLPCSLMTLLFPQAIVRVVFGEQYMGAARLLQLMTPFYVFQAVVTMSYNLLTAINHQKTAMRLWMTSVLLNATLAPLLVKLYGVDGAALSLSVTNAVIAAGYWWSTAKRDLLFFTSRRDLWQWPGFLVTLVPLYWISLRWPVHGWMQLLVAATACVVLYSAVLALTGGLLPEEMRLLSSLPSRWSRRRTL